MVTARGYTGGPDHFCHRIAQLRPRRPREAYLRLRTLAGEQAQVDWAHFGKLTIGRAERPLMAFVLVLSYSRYPLRALLPRRLARQPHPSPEHLLKPGAIQTVEEGLNVSLIAVGTPVTRRPPAQIRAGALTHTAPAFGPTTGVLSTRCAGSHAVVVGAPPVSRFPGAASGTCFGSSTSRWPRPFPPPTPPGSHSPLFAGFIGTI